MIAYLEHKNIDKKKWDACIEQSVNSCIYAYSWYLDAVCKNWTAIVLDDYKAVLPLAPRSKYSIHYINLSSPVISECFQKINVMKQR